jgi:hypothetical protein
MTSRITIADSISGMSSSKKEQASLSKYMLSHSVELLNPSSLSLKYSFQTLILLIDLASTMIVDFFILILICTHVK